MTDQRSSLYGHWAAFTAYFFWGTVPVYWKAFAGIGPVEIIMHRVFWTFWLVLLLSHLRGSLGSTMALFRTPRRASFALAGALLLSVNWGCYVWAVTHDNVVAASLGYFLCPLVSIFLGRVFEGEHLSRTQWAAVTLAFIGVALMVASSGELPLASLLIAFSWGSYGLTKKRTDLGPITSLTIETGALLPFATAYLAWKAWQGTGALSTQDWELNSLLYSTGLITASPLLLFAFAARRVPLTTMGILQFLVPSITLATAVLHFKEPFSQTQQLTFGFTWCGIALYVWGLLRKGGSPPKANPDLSSKVHRA